MEHLLEIINIVGIISFSAAGAMVAIDKETDFFGVVFISMITCFFGGILRDVFVGDAIGRYMPLFFYDMKMEITVCIFTAIIVFFLAMIFKEKYVEEEAYVEKINNVLDALGIGVFAAAGTSAYMELGFFVAVLMGMLSSIGGSITRDVILCDIPVVLRKRIYALACLGGSIVYYITARYVFGGRESADLIATLCCVVFIFAIRMCATAFKWNMPKAIIFSQIKTNQEDTVGVTNEITK